MSYRYYNVQEHPKYKNGEMTKKEVFEEFLEKFEPDQKDGKVGKCFFKIDLPCKALSLYIMYMYFTDRFQVLCVCSVIDPKWGQNVITTK